MSSRNGEPVRFARWIARPQSLIALSAVLLSLCGLFIAIYEASLIRRQQRAAVWPYVEVSVSWTGERIAVGVQNTGVGPARVRAAAVTREGEVLGGWAELMRRVGAGPEGVDSYYSLVHGRVLPRDSESEVIFRVTRDSAPGAPGLLQRLRREIQEGRVDVTLCYCSVFEECWISSLQDVLQRGRGVEPPDDRPVAGCEQAPRSAI